MARKRKKRPSWRDHTYWCQVTIQGTHPLIFNKLKDDGVKEVDYKPLSVDKTRVEEYLWWDRHGRICVPGKYLCDAVISAGGCLPDSRDPKRKAHKLFQVGLVHMTDLAVIGPACDPGFSGRCSVDYMESPAVITGLRGGGHLSCQRTYPAFKAGWEATFKIGVVLAGHIPPPFLHEAILSAGKLVGMGWRKPTYGRFFMSKFQISKDLGNLKRKEQDMMWDACTTLPDMLWDKECAVSA